MQQTLLKQSNSSAVSGRSAVKCAAIKKDGVISKTIMGAFAASILASSLCIQTPSMAGEILPEKKIKKAFVKEDKESAAIAIEDIVPIPLKTGGLDPYAPIGRMPEPNIPDFKGSYNAEPIPGRSYPPPPGPRKEPTMDMDSGKPPVSFTLNKQLGYTIPVPSDEKWVIEYKPPEPKFKFRFPGITPEYDPNLYWDSREEYPDKYRAEPTYPYLYAFPQIIVVIAVTYLVASKVDPGWNDFFKKTVVKDVFEEGLGTEDILKAEVPIILPYEREAMERDDKKN